MIYNKSKVIALGALNGILFGASVNIWYWFESIYKYEKAREQKPLYSQISIDYPSYDFDWWYFPLLSFVFFTLSTAIVSNYLSYSIKSSVRFWQTVGVVVAIEVIGVAPVIYLYKSYFGNSGYHSTNSLVETIKDNLAAILIIFLVIGAFNLIYAYALKLLNAISSERSVI